METAKIVGIRGEEAATKYLQKDGFRILERNARFGREEIDIVAYDTSEKMIVFAEVKTRTKEDPRYPVRLAATRRKRAALRRAIDRWIHRHGYTESARLDLLVVVGNTVTEHLKDLDSDFY